MHQNPNTPPMTPHHHFRPEHMSDVKETFPLPPQAREKNARGTAAKHRFRQPHMALELSLDLTLGRVLVVEGQTKMRAFLTAMLNFDGYQVGEFEDVYQMIRHIDSLPSHPSIAPPD